MAQVDGEWACVTRTPMGPQEFVLTVKTDGKRFTGRNSGALGSVDIVGDVEGDELRWTMELSLPFPMTLAVRATVSGDSLEGSVDTGAMGTMPLSGTRKA